MIHAVIITGASKGFGRAVAKTVARGSEYDVHFVLSGRDQTELDEARSELFEIRQNQKRAVTCDIIVGDLSNLVQLEKIADSLFGPTCLYKDASNIQSITFFNNAGSLGTLCPVGSSSNNIVDMSAAVNLNVTACTYLTSEFVRRYCLCSVVINYFAFLTSNVKLLFYVDMKRNTFLKVYPLVPLWLMYLRSPRSSPSPPGACTVPARLPGTCTIAYSLASSA